MIHFPKTMPAPTSLAAEKVKSSGTYRQDDVIQQLKRDFCDKCYICESKSPSTINLEHFEPHQGDVDKKFDWNNLFWSCGHCNNTKLNKFNRILNCTIEADRVETQIRYECELFPKSMPRFIPLSDDERVRGTCELLNAVFCGTTPLKAIESDYLRDKLISEICQFNKWLLRYFGLETFNDRKLAIAMVKGYLSKEGPFTAFMRWIVRSREPLLSGLADHLPSDFPRLSNEENPSSS